MNNEVIEKRMSQLFKIIDAWKQYKASSFQVSHKFGCASEIDSQCNCGVDAANHRHSELQVMLANALNDAERD